MATDRDQVVSGTAAQVQKRLDELKKKEAELLAKARTK